MKSHSVCVTVNPGNCGFSCFIEAQREEPGRVTLQISGSECEHIQRLSEHIKAITAKELFLPLSRNPVFVAAEGSVCHTSCPIPVAVLKAAEVAMDMALPQDVLIQFEPC
jgi:hypothetical protein